MVGFEHENHRLKVDSLKKRVLVYYEYNLILKFCKLTVFLFSRLTFTLF